jgi:hypothetical protein
MLRIPLLTCETVAAWDELVERLLNTTVPEAAMSETAWQIPAPVPAA